MSKVDGISVITITNNKKVSSDHDDLTYFEGSVALSADCTSVKSHVIVLPSAEERDPKTLFVQRNLIPSPYIVRALAYGRGLGKFSDYRFLAVPQFNWTFARYIQPSSRQTINKNRFTEEFIEVIRNTVHGILTLHGQGFYCPYLRAWDVLISIVGDMITSKIWNFRVAENAAKTSADWIRLGRLIQRAADKQLVTTAEICDLCDKLINKNLKGLHILKHSAMLTVRQKFDNILALNLYILVNSVDQFTSAIARNPEKMKAIADLQTFMKRQDINWCREIPSWIKLTKGHQTRSKTTCAEFVFWLRYIVEHEFLYIPPKTKQSPGEIQKFGREPDLEAQIRALMEEIFLQAQNLTVDLDIEY